MSLSPYKRKLPGDAVSKLQTRSGVLRNGPHYHAATRNPAYITIKGKGMSLPDNGPTHDNVYMHSLKPGPILLSATIRSGGDFGLLLELEVSIQCHTRASFAKVEKAFLYPGTDITATFGYAVPRKSGYASGHTVKGFKVATYSFNTTPEGFWIASFKACAPGIGMMEANLGIKMNPFSGTYKVDEDSTANVHGLAELIAYDAEINGSMTIDEMADGEVLNIIQDAALVVYHPAHTITNKPFFNFGPSEVKNGITETDNFVYLTLGYIVNRLINEQVLGAYRTIVTDPDFKKCVIKFDPVLSKSYPDSAIRSAWPLHVLLLGFRAGNYLNDSGEGKDFEIVQGAGLDPIKAIEAKDGARAKIDLKKILIEKTIVIDALKDLYVEKKEAETTDPKQSSEGVLELKTFFNKIFNTISESTGGMLKLRLAMHPDIHAGNGGDKPYEMYIFDENNGNLGSEIDCVVFNPIDGDGSTRTCQLTSNVGSKEYQASLWPGMHKKADPIHEATTAAISLGNTIQRFNKRFLAQIAMEQIIRAPGPLAASQFDEIHCRSLEECLGSLRMGAPDGKKKDMLIYPGIGIEISIDGVFGFSPGNAIITNQLTSPYFEANAYFFVERVEHVFSGDLSDWETKLSGKLSFHSAVKYIRL